MIIVSYFGCRATGDAHPTFSFNPHKRSDLSRESSLQCDDLSSLWISVRAIGELDPSLLRNANRKRKLQQVVAFQNV